MGPKWVSPRGAQVGGPTWGPSGPAQAGPKWAQARNLGPKKIPKIKILKIKIRSAQNVGKVLISRKKSSRAHLGPSGPIFCVGRKNRKRKMQKFCLFSLVGPWALSPGLGPLLLSTRGGAIGSIDNESAGIHYACAKHWIASLGVHLFARLQEGLPGLEKEACW